MPVSLALDVDQQIVDRRTYQGRIACVKVALAPGLCVCFTGDTDEHPRDQLVTHAANLGLTVVNSVTKQTRLLIAADLHSNSGKAKKADQYNIPIATAADFARACPGDVIGASGIEVASVKVVRCRECGCTWTVRGRSGARTEATCLDCKRTAAAERQSRIRPVDGAVVTVNRTDSSTVEFEMLTCLQCCRDWQREAKRGRKPSRCPNCA
ncbi:MAG: BRCT domain-containing protein [Egibacteraceae bacterium]